MASSKFIETPKWTDIEMLYSLGESKISIMVINTETIARRLNFKIGDAILMKPKITAIITLSSKILGVLACTYPARLSKSSLTSIKSTPKLEES